MPLKSLRPFDFFWYGDNSKVNNIAHVASTTGSKRRHQRCENWAVSLLKRAAHGSVPQLGTQSRPNDAKNVSLLDPRKIRKCYFHGIVVALGQREFKLLSDPGTAAAWLRAKT